MARARAAIDLLLDFQPDRTPRLRLAGDPVQVARAGAILAALFGPSDAGPAGWNISPADFEQAERAVFADAVGGGLTKRADGRWRLLLGGQEAAPTGLVVEDRPLRFSGYGRTFEMAPRQAQAAHGDRALTGRAVRFAYYGAAPGSAPSGRSRSRPQP